MSEYVTGVTASGGEWVPTFIVGNNIDSCVSCAKCFKVCGRGVFEQVEHPDKDGMCGAMVMGIAAPGRVYRMWRLRPLLSQEEHQVRA